MALVELDEMSKKIWEDRLNNFKRSAVKCKNAQTGYWSCMRRFDRHSACFKATNFEICERARHDAKILDNWIVNKEKEIGGRFLSNNELKAFRAWNFVER